MPEFVAAFDVQEGDGMYLPPEERVKIWYEARDRARVSRKGRGLRCGDE
jgi:hypothetical protein